MLDDYYEWLSIGVPVFLACLMNGIIYGTGMNAESQKERNPWLPPGYVIAIIWIILFGMLGYVFYHIGTSRGRWAIGLTLAFCLSYPLITGLRVSQIEKIMNGLTLGIAVLAAGVVAVDSWELVYFMIPLVLWATYVNVATLVLVG